MHARSDWLKRKGTKSLAGEKDYLLRIMKKPVRNLKPSALGRLDV